MSEKSAPNNAAFLSDVVRETEWYADQALEMASCNRICGSMISVQLAFLLSCRRTTPNCKLKRGES